MQTESSPVVLTFNASDPTGAFGIQADLACFAAMGCHGLSVLTSVLVADTARVEDVLPMEADWVSDQARVVLEDMPVAAIKIGALGSVENVTIIAEIISDYPDIPVVLDPFLSGLPEPGTEGEDLLLAMRELLIPQSTLFVASAVELGRLAETWREASLDDLLDADVAHLTDTGCEYILLTGASNDAHEILNSLYDGTGMLRQDGWQRLPGPFSGAGSTISATIAALLANGMDVPEAAAEAQEYAHATLANAHRLGMGKLTPDRYFWARDEAGEPNPSSKPTTP